MVQVFVVGHDWGAIVAWHLCLFRPDRVKALVNMTLPYFPRHPSVKPTDRFKALGEGFYITQFQVKFDTFLYALIFFFFDIYFNRKKFKLSFLFFLFFCSKKKRENTASLARD